MVRRNGEIARKLREGAPRVRGKRLTRLGNERAPRMRGRGTSRCDWTRIVLFERMSGQCDCTLYELVRIVAATCCRQEQPLLEVDLG
jgi:hypothetical protein